VCQPEQGAIAIVEVVRRAQAEILPRMVNAVFTPLSWALWIGHLGYRLDLRRHEDGAAFRASESDQRFDGRNAALAG
jgi:hypothetical protein